MSQFWGKFSIDNKKTKLLIVSPDNFEHVRKASRNLQSIENTAAQRLNALDILRSKHLLLAKESIAEMEKYYLKKD